MNKVYVIAEGACAHNGQVDVAKRMIDIAIAAQCNAVKFQIFEPELIPNISKEELKYLQQCQFSVRIFEQLRDYCDGNIDFLLTPFDTVSVAGIVSLNLDTIKVPSGRLFDKPFMDAIKATGKKLIISTGMCNYEELRLTKRYYPGAKWLHCVSSYPCKVEDLNLSLLRGSMFNGLSDHTLSTWIPAVAVGMGAEIIEKHFTLSRGMPGPDMKVSLEPTELMEMVRNIRDVEKALGDGVKKIEEAEKAILYRRVN